MGIVSKQLTWPCDMQSTSAILGGGVASALLPDANPMGLHYVMFTPTIAGQVIFLDCLLGIYHVWIIIHW